MSQENNAKIIKEDHEYIDYTDHNDCSGEVIAADTHGGLLQVKVDAIEQDTEIVW